MAREHTRDCVFEHECLTCFGNGVVPRTGVFTRIARAFTGWTLFKLCPDCKGDGIVRTDVTMHYTLSPPEPDVGLFGYGVEEDYFTYDDGRPLPQKLVELIDEDEAWRERCYADAAEPDYPDYDDERYD